MSSRGPVGVCAGLIMLAAAAVSAATAVRRRDHDPGYVPVVVGVLVAVAVAASMLDFLR